MTPKLPCPRPARVLLEGRYARLEPLAPAHLDDLLAASADAKSFDYLFDVPPRDRADLLAWIGQKLKSEDPLFHAVIDKLRQDGLFMVGVPNAVNLRKRISVPFGYGKWTAMQDWYEAPRFRGHVREPDVDDLKYIARDLQLMNWRILGKNWIGHSSSRIGIRAITKIADPILQWIPQLCSDIYLVGKKQ